MLMIFNKRVEDIKKEDKIRRLDNELTLKSIIENSTRRENAIINGVSAKRFFICGKV